MSLINSEPIDVSSLRATLRDTFGNEIALIVEDDRGGTGQFIAKIVKVDGQRAPVAFDFGQLTGAHRLLQAMRQMLLNIPKINDMDKEMN